MSDAPIARPRPGLWLAVLAATALCVAVTVALFDRAYPMVDVGLGLTRAEALARARALAATERLAPADARVAARFESNDTLSTYVDLAAGGPDSLRALVSDGAGRRAGVPVYTWAVRLFEPGSPREAMVRFAPDGRVVAMARTLAQDEPRPTVSEAAGRAAADAALARWGNRRAADYRLASASYVTQPRSGRVDRTYVYERVDAAGRPVRIGEAPVRLSIVVTGDSAPGATARDTALRGVPLAVSEGAEIPETFERRYAEMRSANDLFAELTYPGMGLFFLVAIVALVRLRARGELRLAPATVVGAFVGVLIAASSLNSIPGAWFDYDTATAPANFVAQLVLGAVLGGVGSGVVVATMVAAAEGLTRNAYPQHYDWYAYWRARGTAPIAARVLAGYALAAFGFAYVTLFYVATRTVLGWWVPTGTLDDPNQIATPLPWVPAVGLASFAGIWEEAMFRAIPLAALALWARGRTRERAWMASGVVVTALVFGFGHANYQSWPPYSRGVELFVEAALWAVLYLRVGLPTTIVAHVLYDLVWFGLFALHGSGPEYRTTFAIVLVAFLFPALAVAQGWAARRRAGVVTDAPRFADWRPVEDAPRAPVVARAPLARSAFTAGTRRAAAVVAAVGALVAVAWPKRATLGPEFTAPRASVVAAADSALSARGARPEAWRRLLDVRTSRGGPERRFLDETLGGAGARARVERLATTYLPATWWEVRYVHTAGAVAERAEEWRVRVLPDGRVLDVARRVPEGAPGASPAPDAARALAGRALALAAVPRDALREVELQQTPRPARLDTRVEYEDAAAALPGGASARVRVLLAGDVPTAVVRVVQLPERFERADRERADRRGLAQQLGGLALFALVLGLLLVAARRPEHPDNPRLLDRRGAVTLGVAAGVASLLPRLDGLPSLLAAWPTSMPWTRHLGQTALTLALGVAVLGTVVAALWLLADALRRRTDVPFWPSPSTGGVHDAVLAGSALGLGTAATELLVERLRPDLWPAIRGTTLDRLVPVLDGAVGVLGGVLVQPVATIVPLVVALAVRGWGRRAAVLLLAAALLAPVVRGDGGLLAAGLVVVVQLAIAAALIRAFGAQSGLAWVFAVLAGDAVEAVRGARLAANATDATAALLGAATAVLVGIVLYRVASVSGPPSAPPPSPAPPSGAPSPPPPPG